MTTSNDAYEPSTFTSRNAAPTITGLPVPDRSSAALRAIVNVLGPEICECGDCCPGLHAEAAEALRIAKEALGVRD